MTEHWQPTPVLAVLRAEIPGGRVLMGEGLVDRLPHYGLDASGNLQSLASPTQVAGALIRRDHLLAMLGSDKTVARVAAEHCQHQGVGKSCCECWEIAFDMLRVLAGEGAE